MMNLQPQANSAVTTPQSTVKTGSTEYWQILSDVASGKERVYSHEYVMTELRRILKNEN